MIKIDSKTGKKYINNIPEGKLAMAETIEGRRFKIIPMNANNQEDSWYNDRFIGDYYAVFEFVQPSTGCGFWQQRTKWYMNFGNAQRKLFWFAELEY